MKTKMSPGKLLLGTILTVTLLSACSSPSSTNNYGTQETETPNTSQPMPSETPSSKQLAAPVAGDKVAVIETDLGTIRVKLFPEQTPESVKNLEELAKAGKYKDVPFHRIVDGFVIQTGDFTKKNGTGGHSYKGPGTTIPNEIHQDLRHLYGALGMARTAMPDTNGSQFYFVTNKSGTPGLDGAYTVFGQTYEGLDIMEKIAAVETDRSDRPLQDVLMKNVTVTEFR